MPTPPAANEILDREFLDLRARLIDVAAALDRIDRAEGAVLNDPRLGQIRQSLQILSTDSADRAERIQMVFSLPYREDWRQA
ncbi:MAG TPA: hypothetical protein VMY42_03250 [Thermoguttaceae bacterium]|nr:hypothetical protein [Thermoguttaceae bacterium]